MNERINVLLYVSNYLGIFSCIDKKVQKTKVKYCKSRLKEFVKCSPRHNYFKVSGRP